MNESEIFGLVDLIRSEFGDFRARKATIHGPVHARVSEFNQDLDFRGATLGRLELSRSRIAGELLLVCEGIGPVSWEQDAELDLSHTHVTVLNSGIEKGWPQNLKLYGLTYDSIGGAQLPGDPTTSGSDWFINWLARDRSFSRQPFHQCAKVLTEMGHPEMAADVLYAGREREREEAWRKGDNPRAARLELSKWLTGYGLGRRLFVHPLLARISHTGWVHRGSGWAKVVLPE